MKLTLVIVALAATTPYQRVLRHEEATRAATDFSAPRWRAGSDPHGLVAFGDRLVGALAGEGAVVLLDRQLEERHRLALGRAGALTLGRGGEIWSGGPRSATVDVIVRRGDTLERVRSVEVPGVTGVRSLAVGAEGAVYVLGEGRGTLWRLAEHPQRVAECHGPGTVMRRAEYLVLSCVYAHNVRVWRVDSSGAPILKTKRELRNDGPVWSSDAGMVAGELVIVAGGVEDHPLDRAGGAFGYVDSYIYVQRGETRRAFNVAELGVVTPKALHFDPPTNTVTVFGYGSEGGITVNAESGELVRRWRAPPGSADLVKTAAGYAVANPLLDAWVGIEGAGAALVRPAGGQDPRPPNVRLGEALFFTTLMAPWNRSVGAESRFTCETCHYEGYGDGRVHHSGRGDIRVSTKPLRGLFNNRPHFSRALDHTTSQMVFAEFQVANRLSGKRAWFQLERADFDWLQYFGELPATLEPEFLRSALLEFFVAYNHAPNPWAQGRRSFSVVEQQGARVFAERCESCHSARLVADDSSSRQPVERWESLILSEAGPIVWGRDGYEKTGVTPYPIEHGTRPPSLRRLYKKWPYLTDGSAKDIDGLLEKLGWNAAGFFHRRRPDDARRLNENERLALEAFLRLL